MIILMFAVTGLWVNQSAFAEDASSATLEQRVDVLEKKVSALEGKPIPAGQYYLGAHSPIGLVTEDCMIFYDRSGGLRTEIGGFVGIMKEITCEHRDNKYFIVKYAESDSYVAVSPEYLVKF